MIIALTGIRQPSLIDSWTHLFKCEDWSDGKQEAVLDVVRAFQSDLTEAAETVEERNEARVACGGRKFVAFNPRIFETSVSI